MVHVANITTAPGAIARLGEVLETLLAATARHLAYRRSLRELAGLDDRLLKDIGLTRADIGAAARNSGF